MNKYLPVGCFPFFQQRCVIGLFISGEIICLGTGWHHQGENSITILYSAQVKLTISLFHLLLKSYSMSLPLKKKIIKEMQLVGTEPHFRCTLYKYEYRQPHCWAERARKGSEEFTCLWSLLVLLSKAWSVKNGSKNTVYSSLTLICLCFYWPSELKKRVGDYLDGKQRIIYG